jgi:hypothetical protein
MSSREVFEATAENQQAYSRARRETAPVLNFELPLFETCRPKAGDSCPRSRRFAVSAAKQRVTFLLDLQGRHAGRLTQQRDRGDSMRKLLSATKRQAPR